MVNYVNGFSCIMNNQSKQLLFDFTQEFPEKNEKGFNGSNIVTESVATIVMDLDVVERMYHVLKGVFEKGETEKE